MPTVSYITPITNRTRDDVEYAKSHQNDLTHKNKGAWNYTDANRVCNNLKYAAEYMFDQGFLPEPYSMQIKLDWNENDIISYEQLNTMIVNNMNNLKSYSRSDLKWHEVSSIMNMNYATANWLEQNIDLLATQEPLPPDEFELTVEHGTGSGSYQARTVVNIQADAPETGYVFSHWSGDHLENIGSASAMITTYTMPNQDITLTANYTSAIPHILTITTYSGTETVSLSMGAIKYIEADPAPDGKVFHHWEIEPSRYSSNLYEPASSTHFTMPNDTVSITAVYITKGEKQLVVRNGRGSGWYEYDTYASISSNKPTGAIFTNWSGDTQYLTREATEEYNSVKIPDVSVITVRANWVIPPVTGVLVTIEHGHFSGNQISGSFTEGDRLTIVADPPTEGNTFAGWVLSGGGSVTSNNSTTIFTVGKTATTITATYRPLEYHNLTVTTDSGTTTVSKEKEEYFSVNANPPQVGYTFDRWTGNTSSYGGKTFKTTEAATGTYMGEADRTITASYRLIEPHTLTVKQLNGDITYTEAEFSKISITADNAPTGQRFTGWSLSGKGEISSRTSSVITYTFGDGDATLTPNYVNVWTITVEGGTIDGRSSALLDQGSRYRLVCRDLAIYEKFDGWLNSGPGTITNPAATSTYFTVGEGNATITPSISQYPDKTLTVYSRDPETLEDTLLFTETYTYGTTIPRIVAPVAPNQTTFLTWIGDVNILSPSALASTVSINHLTADTTITATYYYPESPEAYMLTVYDGYGSGTFNAGSQVPIRANTPSEGWEFYKWYGDTQYLVNPDLTEPENSVIIPQKAITLYAKFKVVGELPLWRVSVIEGTASGTYTDSEEVVHEEEGVYIDVPAGTEVTLTAAPDTTGHTFDYWEGNFETAGVDDIIVTNNPTVFTMVESDLNITAVRRELDKYTVYTTDATGPGRTYPGTYPISGTAQDTDDKHYVFTGWTCVDADDEDCIDAIEDPSLELTNITITDKDLWITAHYTTYYKLTVAGGQDTGSGYYYEGEEVVTVYANTPEPESRLMFDYWDDPSGIVQLIYDKTPTIIMGDAPAMITAVFTSLDARGNSVAVTGDDLHSGTIHRTDTNLINGIYAEGTIVFDGDGCIGVITEVDPDQSDNTDDYSVQKLFYGGNF